MKFLVIRWPGMAQKMHKNVSMRIYCDFRTESSSSLFKRFNPIHPIFLNEVESILYRQLGKGALNSFRHELSSYKIHIAYQLFFYHA